MNCKDCADKNDCILYNGKAHRCWYEVARENQKKKQEHNCSICKADCFGRGKQTTRLCEYFEG